MQIRSIRNKHTTPKDPPFLGDLFGNPAFSVVWLVVRLFVGYSWLTSGWAKFNNPAWNTTGTALQGFWTRAVTVPPTGSPPITYDWYRGFLQAMLDGGHYTWFAKVIMFGELAVGVALIVGAFVGVAAMFGALMNLNFMLAGSASSNPVLLILAITLMLSWKVAGYWGVDRWLLATVGMPWEWGGRGAQSMPAGAGRGSSDEVRPAA